MRLLTFIQLSKKSQDKWYTHTHILGITFVFNIRQQVPSEKFFAPVNIYWVTPKDARKTHRCWCKVFFCHPILTEIRTCLQILVIFYSIKFHENFFSGSPIVTWLQHRHKEAMSNGRIFANIEMHQKFTVHLM